MKEKTIDRRVDRQDRRIRERIHDPYATQSKLQEPSACPDCSAVWKAGRWTWMRAPADAHVEVCPACRRVADSYPAGELTISGSFLREHREEILHLARNTETTEKAEHPLHRIINIADGDDAVTVTTTDIHLPRRIGEALHHAYEGRFDFDYDEEGYFIRCRWHRAR